MSMNDFTSTLAPAIHELILYKRSLGKKYIHGEVLLGHFDRFCVEINYSGKEHLRSPRATQSPCRRRIFCYMSRRRDCR